VIAWLHGTPISQHTGRHGVAEHTLQRDRSTPGIRQQAEDGVGEIHQRHQHDQHRDDVEQQFEAGDGALDDSVHGARRMHVGIA